jgi:hypothetical protein
MVIGKLVANALKGKIIVFRHLMLRGSVDGYQCSGATPPTFIFSPKDVDCRFLCIVDSYSPNCAHPRSS